ncbi:MAG: OmpA family protein [Bacteroidetes bacterium]|nr:OmpA family protein [Bacteroidota bacterium]
MTSKKYYCFFFLFWILVSIGLAQTPSKHKPLFIEQKNLDPKSVQKNKTHEKEVSAVKRTSVRFVVSDISKGTPLDSPPTIVDELSGEKIEPTRLSDGEYDIFIETNKIYKVECKVEGYKPFVKSVNISKEAKGEDNRFQLELTPFTKKTSVKIVVVDEVKALPIDYMPTVTDELTGKKAEIKKLADGEYEVYIEKDKLYKVECNAIGYKAFDKPVNISKEVKGEDNRFQILLTPLKVGESFILKNIYFHPNTPVFKSESNKELQNLYKYMASNPEAVISIEGHTNSNRYIKREKRRAEMGGKWAFHGTAKKLSKKRASEVKDFLNKKGVEQKRIKTKGWGGDQELYPEPKNFQESLKNMRVEVHILKM